MDAPHGRFGILFRTNFKIKEAIMVNKDTAYLKTELKLRDAIEVLEDIDNSDLLNCDEIEIGRLQVAVNDVLRKIR